MIFTPVRLLRRFMLLKYPDSMEDALSDIYCSEELLSALDQPASNCRFSRLQDNQRHPTDTILLRNWRGLEDEGMKMIQ